jgi:hypothetical protein
MYLYHEQVSISKVRGAGIQIQGVLLSTMVVYKVVPGRYHDRIYF